MQRSLPGIGVYNALLFSQDETIASENEYQQIGRNPELIAKRDNFLLHRFYFKTKIQRKIYADALQEISDETWISKFQISKIIKAKVDNILHIKRQQPSLKMLRESWPHIIW